MCNWFGFARGMVTEWLTLQRELLLCITRYLSAILSFEQELIKSLGLVATFLYVSIVLQEKWVTCFSLHSKNYFKAHNSRHIAYSHGLKGLKETILKHFSYLNLTDFSIHQTYFSPSPFSFSRMQSIGVEQTTVYHGLSRRWHEFLAKQPVLASVIAWNWGDGPSFLFCCPLLSHIFSLFKNLPPIKSHYYLFNQRMWSLTLVMHVKSLEAQKWLIPG